MANKKIPMSAIILAGGKSSRMGCDKALLKIGRRTILEDLARITTSLFSETFIIASPEKNYYSLALGGAAILTDFLPHKGPLVGLYTGLSYSTHQASCVLTCDMPLVNESFLKELAGLWEDRFDAVCPEGTDGRLQPFPGIYRRASRHFVRLLLDRGENTMRRLFDILVIRTLSLNKKEEKMLMNMNTIRDYHEIARPLAS